MKNRIKFNVTGWIKKLDFVSGKKNGKEWRCQPFLLSETFQSKHSTYYSKHELAIIYFEIWDKELINTFNKFCDSFPPIEDEEVKTGELSADFRIEFIIAQNKSKNNPKSNTNFYTNIIATDISIAPEHHDQDIAPGLEGQLEFYERHATPKWEKPGWYLGKSEWNDDLDADQQHEDFY